MHTLNQRLDLIESKILDINFLSGRGTANEINFWIFDYKPEDEMAVRSHVAYLKQRINNSHESVRIIEFDLFKLMIDILKEKGYFDKVMQMEQVKKSSGIIEPVKRTLRLTLDGDLIIKKISEGIMPDKDIIFLTGIGKAWPVIRSHVVLNNLKSKINRNPLVMFFPGEYTNELKLFGEITDDNYYRAFKLN